MAHMNNNEFITEWVVNSVKEKYLNDIALVVSHTALLIDGSASSAAYYVPVTKHGYELARTFIYKGVGYDIWAIPWERMERFASLDEYNITMLAEGEVIYAMNSEWARRFDELKKKQLANLADEEISRRKALEAFAQANELYLKMQFAENSDSRMLAGYTADYLAQAVAFSRNMYFKRSQINQIEELRQSGTLPEGFSDAYLCVIKEADCAKQRENCRNAIILVREYLEKIYPEEDVKENNIQDLADWYAELSYTWLRIRTYAGEGDNTKAYMWGILLQSELNDVCGDFGLEKYELMSYFKWDKSDEFVSRAEEIEKDIRRIIISGGGVIHEYGSEEEFLNENS